MYTPAKNLYRECRKDILCDTILINYKGEKG